MRRHALIGALVAAGAQAQAAPAVLGEDELRSAIVGKTVRIDTPLGIPLTVQIAANGLMHGSAAAPLSLYLGSAKDRGRWRVRDGKLCQKWFKWLDAEENCLVIRRDGLKIYWRRDDGKTGTATIEPGPPVLAGSSAAGLGLPPERDAAQSGAGPVPEPILPRHGLPGATTAASDTSQPQSAPRVSVSDAVVARAEPHLVEPPHAVLQAPQSSVQLAALAPTLPLPPQDRPPEAPAAASAPDADPFDGEVQPMRRAADLAAIATLEHRWCLPDAFARGPAPPGRDVGLLQEAAVELDAAPSLVAIVHEQTYPGELPLHAAACLTAEPALLRLLPEPR